MKIGVQTGNVVDELGIEKGYAALKEAGFEGIDWNLDHACSGTNLLKGTYRGKSILEKPLDEVIAYYEEELSVICKHGFKITQAHAPFPAYVDGHPDVLDYSIEIYKRLIEYCDYANCPYIVVHPAHIRPIMTEKEVDDINYKLFTSLIPTLSACKNHTMICIENGDVGLPAPYPPRRYEDDDFCGIPSKAIKIIDEYNSIAGQEVFGLCLDTGHLNLTGITPWEYIVTVGNRLKALHIHDNNAVGDWHLSPFTGTIDWKVFCDALKQINYSGDLSFETFAHHNHAFAFSEEMGMVRLKNVAEIGRQFRKRIRGL